MFFLNQTPANPDTVDKVLSALKQAGSYIANMGEFAFKEYSRLVYAEGVVTIAMLSALTLVTLVCVIIFALSWRKLVASKHIKFKANVRTCKYSELTKVERVAWNQANREYGLFRSHIPDPDDIVTVTDECSFDQGELRPVPAIVSGVLSVFMLFVTLISWADAGHDAITKIIAPSGWAIRSIIQDVSKVK